MYEAHIRIYRYIVIEIGTYFLIFDIENLNFIVSMANPWDIRHAVSWPWLNKYIVPDLTSTKITVDS